MNDTNLPTNPILAKALRILAGLAADSGMSAEWTGALVQDLAPSLPSPPARSEAFVGAYAAGPGLRWHADQLVSLCQAQDAALSPAHRARRRYHARMLGHGLSPCRAEFRPLVTVLLPVHNRAGPLIEAVQSCVDQTWRPVEILVVDDGSTDDVESALLPFGAQVRLVRKDNGGVASARNLGLRLAKGDFIRFLDSDDLLTPEAVEQAVAAFAAVPDADVCYGQTQWIDMRVTPPAVKERRRVKLDDPIRSMIIAFAFTVSTVTIPRWRMLAMPPFEEDLRRSSDWRYWQQLGFARAKAIGLRSVSARYRRFQHSLQATPVKDDDSHAVAVLRGLRDIVRHPHAWPHAAAYLTIFTHPEPTRWFSTAPTARIHQVMAEIAAAVSAPADGGRGELSMLPLLAAINGRIARLRRDGVWPDLESRCVYQALAEAVGHAIGTATRLSDRDLEFWTRELPVPVTDPKLQRFFAAVVRRCRVAGAPGLADALLRRSRRIPPRRAVRLAARLRLLLGAGLASSLACRLAKSR